MKSITDIDVNGKRVLVRCDFNVPLDEQGNITDDFRIKQTMPTVKHLVERKAKVIIMAHLDPDSTGIADRKYTLDGVAKKLSDYVQVPVGKSGDCVGSDVESDIAKLQPGQVILLENLRFYAGETENDPDFAKQLAVLGDIYVNDAFGVDHRAHASLVGVPKLLPAYAGLLLQKEIESLNKAMQNPAKPMVAVIGGTKLKTKAAFINKISEVADTVIISGLLKAETQEQQSALTHPEKVVGPEGDLKALDINEASIALFSEKIKTAKTVLWNGPFGKFEDPQYEKGTLAIAKAIIASGAYSVVGGGETVEFLEKQHILDQFSHVSTGGGAMISYLSGEKLPGLEALL